MVRNNGGAGYLVSLLLLAVVVVLVVVVVDVLVALGQQRTGLLPEGASTRSILGCMCCSWINVVSAPDISLLPSSSMSRPLLKVFGTMSATFMLINSVIVVLSEDDINTTGYITVLSVYLVFFTFPLVACSRCAIQELGALCGLGYSVAGATVCLRPTLCLLGTKVPGIAYTALYVPAAVSFLLCAWIYGVRLFGCLEHLPQLWKAGTAATLFRVSVRGAALRSFQTLPAVEGYVRVVFQRGKQVEGALVAAKVSRLCPPTRPSLWPIMNLQ